MAHRTALTRLVVSCLLGALTFALVVSHFSALIAGVGTWIVVAVTYTLATWLRVGRMTPEETRAHATESEHGRRTTHLFLVAASLSSLLGVGVLLMAGGNRTESMPVEAIVGTVSVAASWILVHMIFALRYARLYFAEPGQEAIDFNHTTDPDYEDFAYLAYTLGMCYQVSDTALNTKPVRRLALRHALLSYLLGVVVVASTINLVVQLASTSLGS